MRFIRLGFVVAMLSLNTPSWAAPPQQPQPQPQPQPAVVLPPATVPPQNTPALKATYGFVPAKGGRKFWEALVKGDKSLLAHDFDGALAAYQSAQALDAEHPLLLLRLGETWLAKADFSQAEAALEAALRSVRADHLLLKAKIQFRFAETKERKRLHDAALAAYSDYAQTAQSAEANAYPPVAEERQKRITAFKQLDSDYAEVRKRIESKGQSAP